MAQTTPVISDAPGVDAMVAEIRQAGAFAVDFEFLWERTYRPIPCLAQLAVGPRVWIVDPIEGAPLAPIAELVADAAVQTVMHAPSADLMLLAMHFDTRPAAVVDVQLVAGFCGYGAGQSLGSLLERVLRVHLAKAESFSDWSKRPLSASQLSYAEEDVAHLFALHDRLTARAEELGRSAWVAEEHERRYGPDAPIVGDPFEAWRKVKGQGRLSGRERAVLRELAGWREQEAARRDRPAGWLMQDRALIDLARRRPVDRAALDATRTGDKMRPAEADRLLEVVHRGERAPEVTLPPAPPSEVGDRVEVLVALGQLMVATRAAAKRLAAPLVATRAEVESFLTAAVMGREPEGPLASGWRRELAGDALLALAEGRLAIGPARRAPYLTEIPIDEAGPAD